MKRQAEEKREEDNMKEPEEREQKRQKEEEPMESEITGGSSSSWDPINPKESDNQDAESAKNKSVPNVKGPSRKEREEHDETHCTYRSWCKHCVKGRGREDVHNRKTQDEKPEVPTIAMDYCFMGKENKKPITILVVKDADNKAMKAFQSTKKDLVMVK